MVSVAADADHLRPQLLELGKVRLESLRLLRAAGSAVLGVKEHLDVGGWWAAFDAAVKRLGGHIETARCGYRTEQTLDLSIGWIPPCVSLGARGRMMVPHGFQYSS